MRFSLILATLGRTDDVRRLLDSLVRQTYKNFELIVVDQNLDDRLIPILNDFQQLDITHVRSEKGLSRARNVGLKIAVGSFIAFPDDDCWYPDETLQLVYGQFNDHLSIDGVCGWYTDASGKTEGNWPKKDIYINIGNVWRSAISFTIFLRANLVTDVGLFDEQLGVGAGTPWGSGEETDYLIRALRLKKVLKFSRTLVLRHPVKITNFSENDLARAKLYAPGAGRVMKKNSLGLVTIFLSIIKCLVRFVIKIFQFDLRAANYYLVVGMGRIKGWMSL